MKHDQQAFLTRMGWNAFFESMYQTLISGTPAAAGWLRARIVGEERGHYRVQLAEDLTLLAELPGRMRFEAGSREELPAVGDWVLCEPLDGGSRAIVRERLERRSCLIRKAVGERGRQVLAANVDVALVLTSANADFSARRVERYLSVIWDGGATPVVVLSKADLAPDRDALVAGLEAVAPGTEVIAVSARTGQGMEALARHLAPGSTLVLLGSSGVGKSTLANALLGEERQLVREIRGHDETGKHTTTGRHLLMLESGALLIDTPGMRELGLSEQGDGVSRLFEDVEAVAARCRFSDCGHGSEPGCAVREAIESGALSEERIASYDKLQREAAYQRRKEDPAEAARVRALWKKRHANAAQHMRRKRWEAE